MLNLYFYPLIVTCPKLSETSEDGSLDLMKNIVFERSLCVLVVKTPKPNFLKNPNETTEGSPISRVWFSGASQSSFEGLLSQKSIHKISSLLYFSKVQHTSAN